MCITVIIQKCPIDSFSYFQWFLVGLYQLEKSGEICLKIKVPLFDKIALFWCNNKYIAGALRRFAAKFFAVPRYNLVGTVISEDGISKTFAIDSKDSPFVFTVEDLRNCDAYFKLQCPKSITKKGFEIADNVILPWLDVNFDKNSDNISLRKVSHEIFELKDKIFPGMIGPRRLGWSCKKKILLKNFENYHNTVIPKRKKRLIAYFGTARFPMTKKHVKRFDFDWEGDLMAFLGDSHTHPNVKREIAVNIIQSLHNHEYDGRMIQMGNGKLNQSLIVPLNEFCSFLSNYDYNLNISGYRLSIPNRFIESFISGTAILSDQLAVKWFLPFDEEVIETVKMGYESNESVNWVKFRNDILNLPPVNPEQIKNRFNQKWHPSIFSRYIIDTTLNLS